MAQFSHKNVVNIVGGKCLDGMSLLKTMNSLYSRNASDDRGAVLRVWYISLYCQHASHPIGALNSYLKEHSATKAVTMRTRVRMCQDIIKVSFPRQNISLN